MVRNKWIIQLWPGKIVYIPKNERTNKIMTETKDSAETEQIGYLNESVVNLTKITSQVIAGFRAELLVEIEKLSAYPKQWDTVTLEKVKEIVKNHSF